MTTDDHHPGVTPTHEDVEPTTVGTEHLTERPASSTASAESPSTAPHRIDHPAGRTGSRRGRCGTPRRGREFCRRTNLHPRLRTPNRRARTTRHRRSMTEAASAPAESQTQRSLFADDELAGLRARWDNVQAGFVDDPQQCVQKADGLVSDAVEQLTSGFAEARSRLEEQWARGEQASTEDLRLALKRYRAFFERLLAV